jgi:hypothetical protein
MYPCDWFSGSYLCQQAENSWMVLDLGPLKRNLRKQIKKSESQINMCWKLILCVQVCAGV